MLRTHRLHGIHEAHHRNRGGDKAGRIEGTTFIVVQIGNNPQRQNNRHDPEGYINKEDPAPVGVAGNKAAEGRPDNGCHQCGPGEGGDSGDQLMFRRRAQDRQPPDRDHQRTAHALQHAHSDKLIHRGG
ncbi:hypothetical protein D3C72_1160590 [compost metagenome]